MHDIFRRSQDILSQADGAVKDTHTLLKDNALTGHNVVPAAIT